MIAVVVSSEVAADGGLRMLSGNLGRAVIKVSAVKPEHRVVEAPARVFTTTISSGLIAWPIR